MNTFSAQAVLLSYNHPNLTQMTLSSLLTHFTAEQIMLVHNGSKAEVVQTLTQNFPHITHHVMPENKGYSGGANEALRAGFEKSPWLAFFTNDIEIIKLPEELPSPGFYAPKIMRSNKIKIDSIGGFFDLSLKKLYHAKTEFEFTQAYQRFSSGEKIFPYIPGTAFLIHRDVFIKNGFFDESLHTYWEDVDYSVRALRHQIDLKLCLDLEIMHKGHRTCGKDPFYTNHLFQRNREIISNRYSI